MKLMSLISLLIIFTFVKKSADGVVIRPSTTRRPRKEKVVFIPPKIKPQLLVFNLDRNIWPIIMDDLELPYKINRKQVITDDCNNRLVLFPHTLRMLQDLRKLKFKLAAICYYKDYDIVNNLLKLFKIDYMFEYKEFSLDSKFDQIEKIQNASKIPFDDIVLFDVDDDEFTELELLDIISYRSGQKGVLLEHVQEAWTMYANKKGVLPTETY